MPEMFYRDANGQPQDEALWAEILGADDAMTWNPTNWQRFPAAVSPHDLWPPLLSDAERARSAYAASTINRQSSYLHSYPAFLRFLEGRELLSRDDVTIAANFTYAWMPRVAVLNEAALDGAVLALNNARSAGHTYSEECVRAVGRYLGDSLVGASKLLHFAAPSRYAIWDSRVARYLGVTRFDHRLASGLVTYAAYLGVLRDLLSYPQIDELMGILRSFVVPLPSRLRGVEMVMFLGAEKGAE